MTLEAVAYAAGGALHQLQDGVVGGAGGEGGLGQLEDGGGLALARLEEERGGLAASGGRQEEVGQLLRVAGEGDISYVKRLSSINLLR